ncbi:MAG: hypothetical protein OXG39_12825 [Chloroflexi bacterium]|nr:hypothetical protein [Chloroflexota bacterium]
MADHGLVQKRQYYGLLFVAPATIFFLIFFLYPIVCSPEEAIDCFLRTHIDLLVIGDSFCETPSSVT